MLAAMNRFAVEPGDVVYVPAGLPHAIGPGVMLTELQEPTSFSVLAEHVTFGLDDDQATLGLGWDVAIDCFDLGGYRTRLDELLLPAAGVRRRRACAGCSRSTPTAFFRATLATCTESAGPRRSGLRRARGHAPVAARCAGTAASTRSPRGRRGSCRTPPAPLSFAAADLQVIVCRPPDPGRSEGEHGTRLDRRAGQPDRVRRGGARR